MLGCYILGSGDGGCFVVIILRSHTMELNGS